MLCCVRNFLEPLGVAQVEAARRMDVPLAAKETCGCPSPPRAATGHFHGHFPLASGTDSTIIGRKRRRIRAIKGRWAVNGPYVTRGC
jgi:hypothetical protein